MRPGSGCSGCEGNIVNEPATSVIELGSSFLLWLGGGSVLTIAISGFLSKFLADRSIENHKGKLSEELARLKGVLTKDVETHKLSLRRAEMLFEREVDAAKDLTEFLEQLMPDYVPGMDYDEMASRVAEKFEHIENRLKIFKLRHAVVLSDSARSTIDKVRGIASEAKFEFIGQSQHTEPSDSAVEQAKNILDDLKNLEQLLLQTVRA